MICVFPADCTDFSTNGIGTVEPSSCTVTETLNGEWELTLTHPLDSTGKWQRLAEGRILRAPVPAGVTPQIKLVKQSTSSTLIYRVATSGSTLRLRSGTGTKHKILANYKNGTQVIVLAKDGGVLGDHQPEQQDDRRVSCADPGGANAISWTRSVTKVVVNPNWRFCDADCFFAE